MISFEGFGVPFNYPVRAIDSSLNTSTPLEEIQSSVITVETGNFPGVVLSWHSLQSETGVAKYVENFNVTASWEAFPPQSLSIGDDLYLLIRGRSDRPETLNTIPLAQVDQDYIDAFIAEAPNLNPQIGGSSGISSTPAYHGEKLILRAKVVHSDFDGDGIADVVENTIPEGETEPYSDYQNPDTDGDEVGDGTELVSSTNPRVATSKPPSVAQSMTPTKDKIFWPSDQGGENNNGGGFVEPLIVYVRPLALEFHGNERISNDTLSFEYTRPQWALCRRNFPFVYVTGSTMKIRGLFQIRNGGNMTASVSGPNGIHFTDIPLVQIEGKDEYYKLKITPLTGKLPGQVKVYDARAELPPEGPPAPGATEPFVLNWKIHSDNQIAAEFPTYHSGYLTLKKPIPADGNLGGDRRPRFITQESTFFHSCVHLQGMSLGPNFDELAAITNIYGGFKDRFVARITPTIPVEGTTAMRYWGPVAPGQQAPCGNAIDLLRTGNGRCGAWADWFNECVRIQGIKGQRAKIIASGRVPGDNFFIVKNTLPITTSSPSEDFPNHPLRVGLDLIAARNGIGLPGQGTDGTWDPFKIFKDHAVFEFGGTLFDPSYGTPPISGPDRLRIWEDNYIAAYGTTIGVNNSRARLNTAAGASDVKRDVIF